MKKNIMVAVIVALLMFSVTVPCYAETVDVLDEATNGTITSWGMLEDNGFFCDSGKQSPYYAWLYTPGGNLIMEGYVDSYRYYPAKGYASITFQTEGKNKGYYSHPSNIIMEWRGE